MSRILPSSSGAKALLAAWVLLAVAAATTAGAAEAEARFMISEYRVTGARSLPKIDIESAVYGFLGPDRTERDIERARRALEQAYADAGLQTVGVSVPAQNISGGIVELRVLERPVGRLRVKGARYSSPRKIKQKAPSLAEGRVINFTAIPRELAALNQLPDRQVIPSLRPGVAADTVDVDLEVKDSHPVHASVELNNRQQQNTVPLRANVSLSVNNLGQTGHSLGFSYQTAPEEPSQSGVYSGYALFRSPRVDWLNVMVQGTKQDSNVSTLSGAAVTGRGSTVGLRLLFNLPALGGYTQSATFGADYKHFNQETLEAATGTTPVKISFTPITYVPFTGSYTGTWQDKAGKVTTQFTAAGTFHLRGVGSNEDEFNFNRYSAGGNFLILQGELSHTREGWAGFQAHGRLHGQISDQALLTREQIAGGGVGTVRGYREAEVVGDSGVFGTLELRSPSLLRSLAGRKAEWRLIAFTDAGWLKVTAPLPEEKNHFDLLSFGLGTQFRLGEFFNASVYAALPKLKQGDTPADDLRILFQGTLSY